MKSRIQAFDRVGRDYRGLTKFILVGQYTSFPKWYNLSFTNVEFRIDSIATTVNKVIVRMK
jgi:hypothetical protein